MAAPRVDFSQRKHKSLGVTTATSHVGHAVLSAVLARYPEHFSEVRMIGLDDTHTQEAFKDKNVSTIGLNYQDLASTDEALSGVELLLLIPPPSDDADEWGIRVLEAATRQSVEFIVFLTPVGTRDNTASIFNRQCSRIRNALETSDIPWVEVESNLLFENFEHCGKKVRDESVLLSPLDGKATWAGVAAIDVGNVLVEIAAHPNKYLKQRSGGCFTCSGPDAICLESVVVPVMEKVLDKEVKLVKISFDECVTAMVEHGDWGGVVHATGISEMYHKVNGHDHSLYVTSNDVKEITGRVPQSFEAWMMQHQAKFRSPRPEPTSLEATRGVLHQAPTPVCGGAPCKTTAGHICGTTGTEEGPAAPTGTPTPMQEEPAKLFGGPAPPLKPKEAGSAA